MKKHYWIFAFIALPLLAWAVSSSTDWAQAGFFQWRQDVIVASGLSAFALCGACTVLSTRWSWLEWRLGGLDRMYQLHKALGITAAVMVFTHWMCEQIPRWLVQAGWLTRPARQARGGGPQTQSWWDLLHHPASEVGLWLAYLTIALVLIALLRWIPYHWFRRLHKVFPLAFLAMVFHAVVLMPGAAWLTPAGLLLAVCTVVGTVAALVVLASWAGQARCRTGTVAAVHMLGDDVLEVECAVNGKGLTHRAGQFVIARFAGSRDPHPFTIASGGTDPHRLRLCIKALGDDTRAFASTLTEGSPVILEGPYGRFDFRHGGTQVWIGAGIGITPFLARLEALIAHPTLLRPARLYFCAGQTHPLAARVSTLCQQAGVDLQHVDAARDGPLELHHAMTPVNDQRRASLWFCGPQQFGDTLERAWRAAGLRPAHFHREYFEFR